MSVEALQQIEYQEDELKQTECGILVLCRPASPLDIQKDLVHRLIKGGNELQHRGEQSSGLVIYGTTRLIEERGLGTLNTVIDPEALANIPGEAYSGAVHLRWTTNGSTCRGKARSGFALALDHIANEFDKCSRARAWFQPSLKATVSLLRMRGCPFAPRGNSSWQTCHYSSAPVTTRRPYRVDTPNRGPNRTTKCGAQDNVAWIVDARVNPGVADRTSEDKRCN